MTADLEVLRSRVARWKADRLTMTAAHYADDSVSFKEWMESDDEAVALLEELAGVLDRLAPIDVDTVLTDIKIEPLLDTEPCDCHGQTPCPNFTPTAHYVTFKTPTPTGVVATTSPLFASKREAANWLRGVRTGVGLVNTYNGL